MEYDDHLSQLFRTTIGLLALEEEIVIKAAWECVNSIVKVLYHFSRSPIKDLLWDGILSSF